MTGTEENNLHRSHDMSVHQKFYIFICLGRLKRGASNHFQFGDLFDTTGQASGRNSPMLNSYACWWQLESLLLWLSNDSRIVCVCDMICTIFYMVLPT